MAGHSGANRGPLCQPLTSRVTWTKGPENFRPSGSAVDMVPVVPPSVLFQAKLTLALPGDTVPVPVPIVVQPAAASAAHDKAARTEVFIVTTPWVAMSIVACGGVVAISAAFPP